MALSHGVILLKRRDRQGRPHALLDWDNRVRKRRVEVRVPDGSLCERPGPGPEETAEAREVPGIGRGFTG